MPESRGATPRFAIYFAPNTDEPLWAFGSGWLGRDAATSTTLPRPSVPGYPPDRLIEVTREPWRYGFHATLKPPFVLAAGMTEERLAQTVRAFTASRRPFPLPPLHVAEMTGFLALTATSQCSALHALADDCVRVFDHFRIPANSDDLTRRQRCPLTVRQKELLLRWGYPFVMDEWRFHMTLTSRLEAEEREIIQATLTSLAAPVLQHRVIVDSICLFYQDQPLSPFRLIARHRFGG